MLRFRLRQLHLETTGRYLLPLPKLGAARLAGLSSHLEEKGFEVRAGGRRLVALKAGRRISVDGRLGLATSQEDMLDAIAPAVPAMLASARESRQEEDVSSLYFSLKRSRGSTELQFFPRMESSRTWTCLRKEGLCGLTPDEEVALRRGLGSAPPSWLVDCVTDNPREGSTPLQVGRRLYYRSSLPVTEFLSSLKTIDSDGKAPVSYVPRNSVFRMPEVRSRPRVLSPELGEWCLVTAEQKGVN